MPKLDDELRHHARTMRARAEAEEERWLRARGLTPELHHKSNGDRTTARKHQESPMVPRGNANYRRYRDKMLGKMGTASVVRRISLEDS